MIRHQVEQLMAAYAKDFSCISLGEPVFSQEFHDERFFHFRLYFFLSKLGKKLVRQFNIKMYSLRLFLPPFCCILWERRTDHNGRLRGRTCQIRNPTLQHSEPNQMGG